ncbi:MAG: 7TM-DISM domain-containing protein, partial [Myxococcota bacterium]|nr:7TM-DISM domain-containing protein [Myxococcota bacterium]
MGVTVLVLTMSPLAHGQTALKTIQPERAETPIGHSFLFLEDPTLTRSPTDVFHALDWGEFSAVPQSSPSLGLSDSAYWFAARVQPRGPRTKAYFLEIGFPQLDHIQLFTRSRGSTQSHPELGDRFPFDARPIPHRHFVFPLELDGNIPTDILLRVASSSPIKVPVTLWERRAFWESDQYSLM